MKDETKQLKYSVLTNAAELIRGYLETGVTDEDLGFDQEKWQKEAERVYEMLMKKAKKYE